MNGLMNVTKSHVESFLGEFQCFQLFCALIRTAESAGGLKLLAIVFGVVYFLPLEFFLLSLPLELSALILIQLSAVSFAFYC